MKQGHKNALLEYVLLPALSLLVAFLAAGIFVALVGQNPASALWIMFKGALGNSYGIGYTLFYATSYIFTGLAVATAFHAGLFNIGGEGQATIAGVGIAIIALYAAETLGVLAMPVAILVAVLFGALWGLIPGALQAYRESHIVITTILFNLIAFPIVAYLVNGIWQRGQGYGSETVPFQQQVLVPKMHTLMEPLGISLTPTPLNASLLLALLALGVFWLLISRTRLGYAIRTTGFNEDAARYAGIDPRRVIVIAMTISGALAAGAAVNIILGDHSRLVLLFVAGGGFIGIAVSLMGRNHPIGILLAAILFGALTQGASEIAFEMPQVSNDAVVIIQGLIILFVGGFDNLFRPLIAKIASSERGDSSRRNPKTQTVKRISEDPS